MEFLAHYGMFLLEAITIVVAILALVGGIVAIASKKQSSQKGHVSIDKLNDRFNKMREIIQQKVLSKKAYKAEQKQQKKQQKKIDKDETRAKVFVVNFQGDIRATQLSSLRQEITAIIQAASDDDEVVICVESGGGMVHAYGLAASQLQRIKDKKLKLTVCVDKVAASGGYLMACVADKIIAAPFAVIGSIGVLAQIPNFHRLLKENHIDFEQITAGQYKRTLTVFGENTDEGRIKLKQDLQDIHDQFKDFITQYRPTLNIESVATGEHWLAERAKQLGLVDEILTSDDYLLQASAQQDIYQVRFEHKPKLSEKMAQSISSAFEQVWLKLSRGHISDWL